MMPAAGVGRKERRGRHGVKAHIVVHAEKPNNRKLPRYWASDNDKEILLVVTGPLGERDLEETWELLNLGARGAMVFRNQDSRTAIREGQIVRLIYGIKNLPIVEATVVSKRTLAWRGQPWGLNLRFRHQLNLDESTRAAFYAWIRGRALVGIREKRL